MIVRISIQRVPLDNLEQRTNVVLRRLRILKNIANLLVVDTGNTKEQAALEAKCHWRFWVDDSIACFLHIDVQDLLLVNLDARGLRANSRDKPVVS